MCLLHLAEVINLTRGVGPSVLKEVVVRPLLNNPPLVQGLQYYRVGMDQKGHLLQPTEMQDIFLPSVSLKLITL